MPWRWWRRESPQLIALTSDHETPSDPRYPHDTPKVRLEEMLLLAQLQAANLTSPTHIKVNFNFPRRKPAK